MLPDQAVRDPDAEALVTRIVSTGAPQMFERGVHGARDYLAGRASDLPPGPPVDFVHDGEIGVQGRRVPVRVYRQAPAGGLPVVVYCHGGGWVIGDIDTSDAFCRRLACAARCVLVSVGYSLAPEHPFPAAVEDAEAALRWAATQAAGWGGDRRRVIAMGDSAGGNLATVAVRRLVASGDHSVVRQILAYPGTSPDRVTQTPFGAEWPLTDDDREWFLAQYLPDDALRSHPDVAPLLADVAGLPPTTLLVGGCDPIAPEGLAYARLLWSVGVPVDLHVYGGQIHGFLTFDESVLPRSREAIGLVANAIENA